MTLDETISMMPSNPLLAKYANHPIVQGLFSRDLTAIEENLPDMYTYSKPLGMESWKEAHLVHTPIGATRIPGVVKVINLSEYVREAAEGMTTNDIMGKEMLHGNPNSLEGLAFAVPITLKDGSLAMYEEYLPKSVQDKKYFDIDRTIDDLIGYAKGLRSLHKNLGLAWGDAKPEHFRYDTHGKPKLNDFGTASITSYLAEQKRETGDFLYRAPESFRKSESWFPTTGPSKSKDVFGFGAVAYHMLTGDHLHQDLFEQLSDGQTEPLRQFAAFQQGMAEIPHEALKKYYHKKLRNVPRKLRRFVKDCIDPQTYREKKTYFRKAHGRFDSGSELVDELQDIKDSLNAKKYFKKTFKKKWSDITLGGIAAAMTIGLFYGNRTWKPHNINDPRIIPSADFIDMAREADETMRFDREPFTPASTPHTWGDEAADMMPGYQRFAQDNLHLVVIANAFIKADNRFGGSDLYAKGVKENYQNAVIAQSQHYNGVQTAALPNRNDPREVIPFILPYAIDAAKRDDGRYVDTEDMMVYLLAGKSTYESLRSHIEEEAKKGNAEAFNYHTYKDFRDKDGDPFLSQHQQEFIHQMNSHLAIGTDFLNWETRMRKDQIDGFHMGVDGNGPYQLPITKSLPKRP